ncbi:hypothetical protein D3C85_813890 [compost metagenome]|jgi:hypothetical protein
MKPTATAAGQLRLRIWLSGVLMAVLFSSPPASAKDPCETALCMWGLLQDSDRDGCDQAIADHFDILVFRKKNKIDWNATAKERLGFTNSCPGADRGANKEINDKFGKSRG